MQLPHGFCQVTLQKLATIENCDTLHGDGSAEMLVSGDTIYYDGILTRGNKSPSGARAIEAMIDHLSIISPRFHRKNTVPVQAARPSVGGGTVRRANDGEVGIGR